MKFEDVKTGMRLINDLGWTRIVTGRSMKKAYKIGKQEIQEVLDTRLTSGFLSGEMSIITEEAFYEFNWRLLGWVCSGPARYVEFVVLKS